MLTYVAYDEERFASAEDCLAGIRQRLVHGWQLIELVPQSRRGYAAIFRMQDEEQPKGPEAREAPVAGG